MLCWPEQVSFLLIGLGGLQAQSAVVLYVIIQVVLLVSNATPKSLTVGKESMMHTGRSPTSMYVSTHHTSGILFKLSRPQV